MTPEQEQLLKSLLAERKVNLELIEQLTADKVRLQAEIDRLQTSLDQIATGRIPDWLGR